MVKYINNILAIFFMLNLIGCLYAIRPHPISYRKSCFIEMKTHNFINAIDPSGEAGQWISMYHNLIKLKDYQLIEKFGDGYVYQYLKNHTVDDKGIIRMDKPDVFCLNFE